MDQTHKFNPSQTVPNWLQPAEARHLLAAKMEDFILAATRGDTVADEPGRALAIRVSPGLGKTGTALRLLAKHGKALLLRGHVLVYVPTLDLAERAADEFAGLETNLPHRVIRGRAALNPVSGSAMCQKSELAKRLSGLVPSITQALCRGLHQGEFIQASCAQNCPYLAQQEFEFPSVIFLPHSFLCAPAPIGFEYDISLRIIDEKCWPTLVRTSDISIEDLMRAPPSNYPDDLRAQLTLAKSTVIDALQNNKSPIQHLGSAGITPEVLCSLANAEEALQQQLEIRPWDRPEEMEFQIDTFDRARLFASKKRQRLFAMLVAGVSGAGERLSLTVQNSQDGDQQIIRMHSLRELARNAPILLLDADADQRTTERVVPGAQFIRIDAKPKAKVVQIRDRTLSNSWLLTGAKAVRRRSMLMSILKREVARADGRGVLLVATKAVLAALHADAGEFVETCDDDALRRPLCGAMTRWFGPRTQGVNDYEHFRTVIIVGRLQPTVGAVEDLTRCVFGDDEVPMERLAQANFPERHGARLMSDGTMADARIRTHPDARAAAMLQQIRECGTTQAVARLRLIAPNQPKRVVLLGNLPLPDLPVSVLTTFEAVFKDMEDEPDISGFRRLESALRATMGQSVRGTRLSAAGLSADLPVDFPSTSVAKEFRRGRTRGDMAGLVRRIAAANNWPATELLLKRPGCGGQIIPAFVFTERQSAQAYVTALWPGHEAKFATPE